MQVLLILEQLDLTRLYNGKNVYLIVSDGKGNQNVQSE
jgi:hypothetical protein